MEKETVVEMDWLEDEQREHEALTKMLEQLEIGFGVGREVLGGVCDRIISMNDINMTGCRIK